MRAHLLAAEKFENFPIILNVHSNTSIVVKERTDKRMLVPYLKARKYILYMMFLSSRTYLFPTSLDTNQCRALDVQRARLNTLAWPEWMIKSIAARVVPDFREEFQRRHLSRGGQTLVAERYFRD